MKSVFFAVAMAFGASAVAAETYICTFNGQRNGEWISPQVRIDFSPTDDAARVTDTITEYLYDGSVDATKSRDNEKARAFRWSLPKVRVGKSTANFRYSMVVQKGSGRVTISAKPAGYRNTFTGNGQCELQS